MTSPHFDKCQKGEDPWTQFKDISTFCVRDLMKKFGFSEKHILKVAHTAARDCARTPIQWSAQKNAGFSDVDPWYAVNPNYKEVNVEAAEKDPSSLLNFYRKLIALRKQYKDTAIYGEFRLHLKGDKRLFVYDKIAKDGSKLTVVLNVSEKRVSSGKVKKYIPEGAMEVLSVYDGALGKNMKPYEGRAYFTPANK